MSAPLPDVPRGGPYVSYFQGGQLVVQRFNGELVIAGDTVSIDP